MDLVEKPNVLALVSSYSKLHPQSSGYVVAFIVNSPDQLIHQIKNFLEKDIEDSSTIAVDKEIEHLKSEIDGPLPDVPKGENLQNFDNLNIASLLELEERGKLYMIHYHTLNPLEDEWINHADALGICTLFHQQPFGPYNLLEIDQIVDKDTMLDPEDNIIGWEPKLKGEGSRLPNDLPDNSYLRFWEAIMGPAFIVPVIDATK